MIGKERPEWLGHTKQRVNMNRSGPAPVSR